MFGFNKKKIINNTIFGELIYNEWWKTTSGLKIVLWQRTYDLEVLVLADAPNEGITKEQENAYKSFMDSIIEKQKLIQDMIEQFCEENNTDELAERFYPTQLIFCRNGDYGLCIDDLQDEDCSIQPDSGLAISFVPEIKLYSSQDEYVAFIF